MENAQISNCQKDVTDLSQEKYSGIMFTDMECTLIGGGPEKLKTWELYQQACCRVSELIDMILTFNNYFVIVSSCHHDAKERVARKYNIIHNYLSEKNRHKIFFFISDVAIEDGKGTFQQFDDVTVGLIGEKVECVDIVLAKLFEQGIKINNIVGTGDDEKDVNMLLRIRELGGKVATIAEDKMRLTSLFHFPTINETTYKSVIEKIAEEEVHIDRFILISKSLKQQSGGNYFGTLAKSPELQRLQEIKQNRINELISLYESGEIDNDFLQKCLYNAELAFRYYERYFGFNDNNQVGDGKEILKKIASISEYHSNKTLSDSDHLRELPKIKRLLLQSGNQDNS